MSDAETNLALLEPTDALRDFLASTHGHSAVVPLQRPSADGVFPAAILANPRPIVGDTRWLGEDVGYSCRNNRRTTLITAANRQVVRIFCAQHVVDEVIKHRAIWSNDAKIPVLDASYMRRWQNDYLPLIRVVPDDAIPISWLSPHERQRLDTLASHPTDVPSIKLALVVRGLYLSKDKPALRAAYGDESELAQHAEWLDRLKAGGDAAELMKMISVPSVLGYAAGSGVAGGARRAYDALGPAAVLIGGIALYAAWRWLQQPSRQQLRSGMAHLVELFAEVAAQQRIRQQHFDAALPPAPTWDELTATNTSDAILGRASIYTLARAPGGHLSAQELAAEIRRERPCSDAKVRDILRSTGCFEEVYRGRWQVGTHRWPIDAH